MEEKKKFYTKKWFIALVVIVVIIGVASVATGGNKSSNGSAATTEAKADDTAAKTEEKTVYTQSETATVDGVDYKVTKVEKSEGKDYVTPKSGKEFVIVTIEITNNSDKTASYNPLYFKMKNSQGQIEGGGITLIDTDTGLESGDLTAGGKVSGTVSFEQPKDDAELSLGYYPLFSDTASFEIKLD